MTIVAGSVALPALTAFGVPLGLRADVLTAGFAGALVAIALLNAVPASGDTWQAMVWTAGRRMMVACAGSLTAGYLAPLVLLIATLPDSVLLGCAFITGGGAQQFLRGFIRRFAPGAEVAS
ncbi:hypothetical protein SNE35_28605 [Paucibacter sp. R3-3]|uniref:Holin n=1 Tax=Roseateles agri TaxID=3098619 RepID=A0ABU5DQ92_9BURK|nr:hypothetical protein [Paucibacter sp. R3-3]MDY0748495.1 hypothetical protein [Paucibacter sp. R3-3]